MAGGPYSAGQVDQFLGTHATSYLYTGATFLTTVASGAVGAGLVSNGEYIDQPFTMPALVTTLTRVELYYTVAGTVPDLIVQVRADLGGNPGAVLQTILVPSDFWTAQAGAGLLSIPIALTGLAAGVTYHLVTQPAGSVGNAVTVATRTVVPAGFTVAQTSVNGTIWTPTTIAVRLALYAGTGGTLLHTLEDPGSTLPTPNTSTPAARWTSLVAGTPYPSKILEYTVGSGTQIRSVRTPSYTAGLLMGVA